GALPHHLEPVQPVAVVAPEAAGLAEAEPLVEPDRPGIAQVDLEADRPRSGRLEPFEELPEQDPTDSLPAPSAGDVERHDVAASPGPMSDREAGQSSVDLGDETDGVLARQQVAELAARVRDVGLETGLVEGEERVEVARSDVAEANRRRRRLRAHCRRLRI